jgi:hypothetical protein
MTNGGMGEVKPLRYYTEFSLTLAITKSWEYTIWTSL